MTKHAVEDWYDHPTWYDVVHEAGTPAEVDAIEEIVRRHGRSRGRRVLEPACGTARFLIELARRGWRSSGFDANPRMVDHARRRVREEGLGRCVTVRRARMEQFTMRGTFDLALCLACSFQYLLSERAARSHLESVAAALRPGGVYLLGVQLADYEEEEGTRRERWIGERDGVRVTSNLQLWSPVRRTRRVRARVRLRVERSGTRACLESSWQFRTYDADQLRSLLRRVSPPLDHVATCGFDYELDRPLELSGDRLDAILVLRKPRG